MKFSIVVIMFFLFPGGTFSQSIHGLDTCGNQSKSVNIYSRRVAGDSLSTSFCIVIKKEVTPHKHARHSEHVMVLEGKGEMKLEGQTFVITKGDLIFIGAGQVHSVKTIGKKPLKVLSIQSPHFDGSDRILVQP